MAARILRIGIFGGTFNPPHIGHLIVAQRVCEQVRLDKLIFVPSFISPHKRKGEDALALHRLRMVRLAIKNNPLFVVSDIEVTRRGTSYTYATLEEFRGRFPGSKLFLIIGADNFTEFHTWKNPERILELASLIVMNRPRTAIVSGTSAFAKRSRFVTVPDIDISSSGLRRIVRDGDSIAYLVPEGVARYIRRHRLYR
jgi:nicotinate-nucleotide adenylyltransferase